MAKQGASRRGGAVDNITGGGVLPHDALDLGHLDRQTFGDQKLQHELLMLFAAQSPRLLAAMRALRSDEMQRLADLAHQLKGSALAIGAFKVAAAAEQIDYRLGAMPAGPATSRDAGLAAALAGLEAALAEAATAIDACLRTDPPPRPTAPPAGG